MAKLLFVKTHTQIKDPNAVKDITATSGKDEVEINDWVLLAGLLDRFFLLVYVFLNMLATTIIFVQYSKT